MENKKKIAVYVDGFNLYHGLRNLKKPYLKWLDLHSLSEKFIDKKSEVIEKIYYFSSIATHLDNSTAQRHVTYIDALETKHIEFIGGNFKKKSILYKNEHIEIKWNKHEEKETDVNISIYIVRDAITKRFDKFIIITNDTDILPAIKMAKNENHQLQFKLITPPTLRPHDSLINAIKPGTFTKLQEVHLIRSLFPEEIKKQNGKTILIPKSYKKKFH